MLLYMRTLALCLKALALLGAAAPWGGDGSIELVETFPAETALDQPDLREAYEVWPELIDAASKQLDMTWFYVSDQEGGRLAPVLERVRAAAKRGVAVRVLADAGFHATYPETLDALDALDGIEVRLFDVKALMGGVLHAKYFLVDGRTTWLGSQNFDWRSLEHIQELGVRVESEPVTAAFQAVFEADWALAGGEARKVAASGLHSGPVELSFGGDTVRVTPVASPTGWLPDESLWDLPRLIEAVDGAAHSVRVQLLTYSASTHEGQPWDALEAALVRAAGRGARVQLLVADWCKRPATIGGLQALTQVEGIEVRMVSIPEHSSGFIPFGRVIHSKYLVVDGRTAWIGTSNWERGYFHDSRNVGLVVEGRAFGERLDRYFESGWSSDLAEAVDPERSYEAPRIGR